MDSRDNNTVSVGIDLHKTQFTVCAITATKDILFNDVFSTDDDGYKAFIKKCHSIGNKHRANMSIAIEATGNPRDFRNLMQTGNFVALDIDMLKFKVISSNTKKPENYDAFSIAEVLLKDMVPESFVCSKEA